MITLAFDAAVFVLAPIGGRWLGAQVVVAGVRWTVNLV